MTASPSGSSPNGIYTLANDVVYDHLVALLNSLDANAPGVPVCVIPYDDRLDKVRLELDRRPNVSLCEDHQALRDWDLYSTQIWATHPTAFPTWQGQGINGVHRHGTHRRYYAFDIRAPFEKFVYLDADTLLLGSLQPIFDYLEQVDFVVYDFQFKDPTHVYRMQAPNLFNVFEQSRIDSEIFCSGMFASYRGLFSSEDLVGFLEKLNAGDAEVLYPQAPDQTILNYMVMRSHKKILNLALHLPKNEVTGNSVTSSHFEVRGDKVYDKGQLLTYLHYIGLSSKLFSQVCAGENIDFPYRETFLHYRYLHEPEKRPQFTGKPKPYNAPPSLMARALKKLGLTR